MKFIESTVQICGSEVYMKNVPLVSKEEMNDIENLYGKPSPIKEVAFSETIEI